MDGSVVVVSILIYLFITLTLVFVYTSRVKRVPPNIALIITGRMSVDPETGETYPNRIVTGGRVFIFPILERVDTISLASMNIPFVLKASTNLQRIEGNAVVKVANDRTSIRNAAERFIGKSEDEIKSQIEAIIVGYMKQQMNVDSAEGFQDRVYTLVINDLSKMGLQVDSLLIH